ncbi:MAG: nucleotide pyrophosphohydrolase [Lachnospiraceae bacterium]|nr:nucleotide pyrophosphohydrolase [Lachnospiraceae bacterium]
MNKTDTKQRNYSMDDFRKIIETLRGEFGCPWDKAQTHGSLTGCMIEEAAEAVSGIKLYEKTGNKESMQEELGDVLMQVVLHARIAEEEGLFTLDDVIRGISEKMVRRHPHVFAPDGTPLLGKEPDRSQVKTWKEIKSLEKKEQSFKEPILKKRFRKVFAKFYKTFL